MSELKSEIKRHGRHYTPVDLADFLARRLLHQLAPAEGRRLRVIDPACGDGELLFAIHRCAERLVPNAAISLTGIDLDGEAVNQARARASELGVEVELRIGNFLEVGRHLEPGVFDVVITNPPYVRTQQLGRTAAQHIAAEFKLKGRIDLTHAFMVLISSLLRADGLLGLLCSNRFLTTRAGANMRKLFQSTLDPVEIYDLGDTKLFSAAVLPAIVVAVNRPSRASGTCPFTSAYVEDDAALTSDDDLFSALARGQDAVISHDGRRTLVRAGTLVRTLSTEEPWRARYTSSHEWLEGIADATWRTFGELARIRVGIKTTADRVFISDDWDCAAPRPEDDLLLPLITHHNVTPWQVSEQLQTKVLYPYDLSSAKRVVVDMNRYPSAMNYLETHGEKLKSRRYVIEGGREWFELWVPHKPNMWKIPKIVFPDISGDARFALDRSGAVVNGDCYWISLADIGNDDLAFLMLAVANSELGKRFYDEVCGNKLYSGRRRWMTQYVSRLPVPDPETSASRQIIQLTRSLLESGSAPDALWLRHMDDLVTKAFEAPVRGDRAIPAALF